jgi:predicted CXXCH cytochrome family protein
MNSSSSPDTSVPAAGSVQPDTAHAAGGNHGRRRRWLLGGAGCLTAFAAMLFIAWWRHDPFPFAPITPSPYRNTQPGVAYVGSAACIACHADEHASFGQTGMGRSMAEVDPALAPPDGAVEHPPSKRRYRAFRRDGKLWHQELLLTPDGEDVVLAEYPLKYVVGSGHHGLTYLVETDGFLVESPLTWYTSRQAWDVSPGYDNPKQQGFARPIGADCLFCHAGRADVIGRSTHRMHVGEIVIGCERCHGPGALHVERHNGGQSLDGAIDDTIVNPAHLSRDLAESICQQCHLNSDAAVTVRGRKLTDFRPGLRFEDFREIYLFKEADQSMTVVGHVEQMHLSRCYQASDSFSCLTCHDPHDEPAPAARAAHTNKVCLGCHRLESCTVSAIHRKQESPDNNCVHCHMPRSTTDIPHLAFTHHRVAVHRRTPAAPDAAPLPDEPPPSAGVLQPFLACSGLSEIDRQRSLGEAYRLLSLRSRHVKHKAEYEQRALDLLTAVHASGLRDGDLEAALVQLYHDRKGDALSYAERALAFPNLAGQSRCDALFVRAEARADSGDYAGAIDVLRELTQLRRYVYDWLYMAKYARIIDDQATALEAAHAAIRVNPRQWDVHVFLADYYRQGGDVERARWHEKRAVR